MNKTKGLILAILISIFIYFPIDLYINFWVLKQLNPDRLIWFLWIINIPIYVFLTILIKIVEAEE